MDIANGPDLFTALQRCLRQRIVAANKQRYCMRDATIELKTTSCHRHPRIGASTAANCIPTSTVPPRAGSMFCTCSTDPLSLTASCLVVISAAGKTSSASIAFIAECRSARSDLQAVSNEVQIQIVRNLLKGDDEAAPPTIRDQILGIVSSCNDLLTQITAITEKHRRF